MFHAAANWRADAVGAAVCNGAPRNLYAWTMHLLEFGPWLNCGSARASRNFPSCCALYRWSVLLEAGGFPEDLFPAEDTVLNTMLVSCGRRLVFEPAAEVHHLHQQTFRRLMYHNFAHGRAYAEACRRVTLSGSSIARRFRLLIPALPALRYIMVLTRHLRCRLAYAAIYLLLTPLVWLSLAAWSLGFGSRDSNH
jgi:GT2 family glycosyltransferase